MGPDRSRGAQGQKRRSNRQAATQTGEHGNLQDSMNDRPRRGGAGFRSGRSTAGRARAA
ncbi:hypothetical protein WQQ_37120 [Hydrocarboniphaga effusa AP103]|uniref:Uncharacterized protein n=1 Tax=Hydrocarboniphaga effusa AP103 TaxID=1172194 RepID=I7ZA49_9GAMM|nr:hypothetical protein WQQ_37120 [Hydrocarboniphaga effusa AP103]